MESLTSPTPSHVPKLAVDGSNWIIWKTRMERYLGSKKLAKHIRPSSVVLIEPSPLKADAKEDAIKAYNEEVEKYEEWFEADTKVSHYISSTIPDSLLIKTIAHKTSKDLWKAICTEHESKTKTFQLEMIRQLHNQRCTEVDDVRAHFAKLLRLREDLAATGEIISETNFTSIITNSLPPSYGAVLSSVYATARMNKVDPTTHDITSIIEEEYVRRRVANGGLSESSTALFTNPKGPSSGRNKKKKPNRCTNEKCRRRHTCHGCGVKLTVVGPEG